MNIHEYQAKEIFRRYEIPVLPGIPAFSVPEAEAAAQKLIEQTGNEVVVVKAQIHAGGRGKGGGVKVVRGAVAAREAAEKLMGMKLVTHQTGPEGKVVRRLLVEAGAAIAREYYLALVVDRDTRRIAVMASAEGGVDIEEVAAKHPEKILREFFDPTLGLSPYQGRKLAFGLGLRGGAVGEFTSLLGKLARLFVQEDCSLAEINPLILTEDNRVLALDAKLNFDENASFRHKEWHELADADEEAETEREAKAAGLSYVQLDGNIGCLVNGAGLAMSTMDIIKHYGGEPANFLDVGGGATQEAVTKACRIILRSKEVKGIFINIFGGIMKCDTIAAGVIAATKELGLKVPLVVRLEGTNVELGRQMLAESGLAITPAMTMADGAQKIVELVSKAS
jgi:succinyl-CoA synthetase beta subunit